jgi:tetratricopeptide (TPR) repeat protein
MKMISKVANVALGLVLLGSSVFAQSLDDAKKAIDAEQYQKAKGMLKNLTVTQTASKTNDENFFYLGWVYAVQDYLDSAKDCFTKGIAINPKSDLNYVGLGLVAHLNKDEAGATSNFNQAINVARKKDSKPYLYIGKGYLLGAKDGKLPAADANAAIDALNKGKAADPKDAEIWLQLGNAYRSQLKSSEAYPNYEQALTLDPKSPAANTAEGVLWRYAENYEDSQKQFQAALAIDPNFGPAYREWAEMDKDWGESDRKVLSAKIQEALDHYKKYLSLTDESPEALMRYADFLIDAGDYKTLQDVATKLSTSANSNARAYRYLAYAAYQNKDYTNGLNAMNSWMQKAPQSGQHTIIARDYLYLGRLELAGSKDTVKGITDMKKAVDLDSTFAEDVYHDIAGIYRGKKDYLEAGKAYEEITNKVHGKPLVQDHLYEGIYYYFAFAFAKTKPDTVVLTKADSALSYVQRVMADKPVPAEYLYRARIAGLRDTDLTKMKGLSKPFYEKYIELSSTPPPTDARAKGDLAEAYASIGQYYEYHDKDDAKALDNFTKARDLNPTNSYAKYYFDSKAGAAQPAGTAPAAGTPTKK